MNRKIVVITGANSGIGKAATIRFAKEGHTVIMACRNLEKSRIVQQQIIESTLNDRVDLIKCDVSSFESIKLFCTEFKNKYNQLDILIHNAAYFKYGEKTYQLSPEHIELTFATNLFGPYLMTQLLIDFLKKSDDPRILNSCTTNIRHFFEPKRKIDFDNLLGEYQERKYSVYKMYGDSKIALLMLTFKIAEEIKLTGIKVNAIQIPAIKIAKGTIKNLKFTWRIAARIQNIFSALPETMGDTYYHICTSKEFKDVTGKLINENREIVQSSHYGSRFRQAVKQFFDKRVYPKYADDPKNINRVWNLCEHITKTHI